MVMGLIILGFLTFFAFKINHRLGVAFLMLLVLSFLGGVATMLELLFSMQCQGVQGDDCLKGKIDIDNLSYRFIWFILISILYGLGSKILSWPAFATLAFVLGFSLGICLLFLGPVFYAIFAETDSLVKINAINFGMMTGIIFVIIGTYIGKEKNYRFFE